MVHCIVTLIDLIGIKEELGKGKAGAIEIMQRVHQEVYRQISDHMENHVHAYCWNDSVLLFTDKSLSHAQSVMKEVVDLRKRIQAIWPRGCYAISVKGMSIPPPNNIGSGDVTNGHCNQPRFVYIKASSMAFANCLEIAKNLQKYKAAFYVDSRIAEQIKTNVHFKSHRIKLLPHQTLQIRIYYKDLWGGDGE